MRTAIRKTTRTEDAVMKRRLISCMPASRFEMETLSRLADIRTTRAVPTAAVECTRRPRLLINPDFVKKYCERDEHLFLLVMHELWHVMLAHTRMYPRMTQAQNIAFDAIINSGLMREFPEPEYRGFFDKVNPPDQFPSCLLRPPEGWPYNTIYPENVGPPGTKEIVMRLYPRNNSRRVQPPLYEEVLNLLLRAGMMNMPFLLGNHESEPINDPYMKEIMRTVKENWPDMQIGAGRGSGGFMTNRRFGFRESSEEARRVFSRTLRHCLGPRKGKQYRTTKMSVPSEGIKGVMPNPRDRMAHARTKLGSQGMIWNQPGTTKARVPEYPSKSHVYLDVSGSMNFVLSHLLHLLLPYVAKGHADTYQFSTSVTALSLGALREGNLATTGGTNINCVLRHLLEDEMAPQRVLILTDGEVGPPEPPLAKQIQERDIKIHIVLPNGCRIDAGMDTLATSMVHLPPMH